MSTGSVPFLIYDESQQKPAVSAVPFKVFEDQENCCPADVVKPPKRRSLSGILQPSLEVQSDPTEEKDCIVMEEPIANVEPVTNVSSLGQSKKEGKGHELIQSSTTPDPGYRWESDNFIIRQHKREPRGQIRVCYEKLFFLFLNQNICCGYSKEPSQTESSFEQPKHTFKLIDKEIVIILRSQNFAYLDLCLVL